MLQHLRVRLKALRCYFFLGEKITKSKGRSPLRCKGKALTMSMCVCEHTHACIMREYNYVIFPNSAHMRAYIIRAPDTRTRTRIIFLLENNSLFLIGKALGALPLLVGLLGKALGALPVGPNAFGPVGKAL